MTQIKFFKTNVFIMDPKINSDYYNKDYKLVGLCGGDAVCFLGGIN
jgi:hypothetical protein